VVLMLERDSKVSQMQSRISDLLTA
jgi:hypothetical protein